MKARALTLAASAMIAVPAVAIEREASSALTPQFSSLPAAEISRGNRVQTGTVNGLTYTAKSMIIGQTPTSDVLAGSPANNIGGGDPIYKPSSNKSGVVALIMQTAGGAFICSGSVIGGGMSIATAAHCVSGGFGTITPTRTTAYFFDGDPDTRTARASNPVQIDVSRYFVHEGYTGEVIDQNDIAILRLEHRAPGFAEVYDLFTADIKGLNVNVAGYGTRSTVGGATGNSAPGGARTGFLREGDNKFDYSWGDPLFQNFFTTRDTTGQYAGQNFFGFAEVQHSYITDFDNGLSAQSTARRIANAIGLGAIGNANFNDNGVGAREVGIAGGDSGGPGFINGKLASINSYGLTFGGTFGDFDGIFNAGWGEFSGYVPTFIHEDFINASTAVPEPSSWAMLIAGFGLTGAMMRRRRTVAVGA